MLELFACGFAVKTADGTIAVDDTMAGNDWSVGVVF